VHQVNDFPARAWGFFDRIYCISLENRADRREQAEKQFAAVGLLERVEFVLVTKHPQNREQGIFESHIQCLKKGLATGAETILIFEDDVFFKNFDPDALTGACSFLKEHGDWNALFLGCITSGSLKITQNSLATIHYRCLSHGYALNRDFAKKIIQEKWRNIPYDTMLKHYNSNFYALYPMCAFQGLSETDNQTVAIDRLRRLFGGLPFIQRANEFYQNHKRPLIAVHLVIFLLAGLILTFRH
jgi:GR25 family glycosyltransferase involved in LPS biosynthesis